MLQLARRIGLQLDRCIDVAPLLGNFCQVPNPRSRDQRICTRVRFVDREIWFPLVGCKAELVDETGTKASENASDARVIELACNARANRCLAIRRIECEVVPLPLLADVAQGILGTPLVELVEDDEVGEIEHVDFFELARGTVIARHDVDRKIHEIDDLTVALPNARRLDEHEIEADRL